MKQLWPILCVISLVSVVAICALAGGLFGQDVRANHRFEVGPGWRVGLDTFGFYLHQASWAANERPVRVNAPYLVAAIIAALPALAWVRQRHDRWGVERGRIRRGECPNCGYDLRAATSDRCSECGHVMPRL